MIRIYTPARREEAKEKQYRTITMREQPAKAAALICFIILNLILGLFSQPIVNWLENGLRMFA